MLYAVRNIAQEGLVFRCQDFFYRNRQPIFGTVRFPDGTVVAVEGTVLRMKIDQVIVCLTHGFSPARIAEEQRRVQRGQGSLLRARSGG